MEELNELKNLVMENLEKNGYLSNIRAQIRSSVFKTIDNQESRATSPFYSENLKLQKLAQDEEQTLVLQLVHQVVKFYKMEHTDKILCSEANVRIEPHHLTLNTHYNQKADKSEPVLLHLFNKFKENQKSKKPSSQPPKKNIEKAAQMPMQMKEDVSEGELQVQQEIVKNESRNFGESEQFGQSQGYDVTVDSLQLEDYDYYEDIE